MARRLPVKTTLLLLGAAFQAIVLIAACSAVASLPPAPAVEGLSAVDAEATELCAVATTRAEVYVLLYDLYGTPTPSDKVLQYVTPAPTATLLPGDAARGRLVFEGKGQCAQCHSVASDEQIVGPSLRLIGNIAGYKRPGMDAPTYLLNVIVNPDQTIIPLTKPGVMPRSFQQQLDAQEVADVVAYLLTLRG